jgi:cytoskeletal protein CcmA (bactofilin family)
LSIFNKRSQEEAPTPGPPVARPSNPIESAKKEVTPLSSVSFKTPEPDSTRGQDCIGKAVRIEGQIYSQEDLYVDGDVEGTIELQEHRLTIGCAATLRS